MEKSRSHAKTVTTVNKQQAKQRNVTELTQSKPHYLQGWIDYAGCEKQGMSLENAEYAKCEWSDAQMHLNATSLSNIIKNGIRFCATFLSSELSFAYIVFHFNFKLFYCYPLRLFFSFLQVMFIVNSV